MIDKYLYTIVITAVIFNKENRVLLAKRNMKEEILPGYWGIPGGKAETRESVNNFLESELLSPKGLSVVKRRLFS